VEKKVRTDDDTHLPKSIGVIIDGNRRWAKEQGLPSLEGHMKGYEKIQDLCTWARDAGIEEVIVYAFSTENWNRSAEEVSYLMKLMEDLLENKVRELEEKNVRIRVIGDRLRLSPHLQGLVSKAEDRTKNATGGILAFAISYGGRLEILSAVNRLLEEGRDVVTEEELRNAMWSADLHDPDLIIRTGGEKRLSNFLPWQSTYSELFFTDTKWPAFTKEEFDAVLAEFSQRERRHGK